MTTTDSKETLAVPAGWKLAPEDPTVDMIWEGVQAALAGEGREPQKADLWRIMKAYRAMLSAAPGPEESEIRSALVAWARVSPAADLMERMAGALEPFVDAQILSSGEVIGLDRAWFDFAISVLDDYKAMKAKNKQGAHHE